MTNGGLPDDVVRELTFMVKEFSSAQYVNTEYRVDFDIHHHAVRHMLRTHVAALTRKETVTAPATRADALRELFLPKWTRKWFPVKYRELSAEAYAMLPHLELDTIRRKYDVRIAVMSAPRSWMDNGSYTLDY